MSKQQRKRQQGPARPEPPDDVTKRRRVINNCVGYWRVCGAGACRRQRGCAGDAVACFERFWPWTPERIKIQIRASIKALNEGVTSAAELTRIVDAEVERAAEHIARVDAETERAWDAQVAAEADAPHLARSASHPLPASREREARSARACGRCEHVCPTRGAARLRCTADAGPPETVAVPGLQRIIACCAAPGTKPMVNPSLPGTQALRCCSLTTSATATRYRPSRANFPKLRGSRLTGWWRGFVTSTPIALIKLGKLWSEA